MTKTTKILLWLALALLIFSVVVGVYESSKEEFGALAAIYPGIGFAVAFAAGLFRLLFIDSPKANFLGKDHKKLDSYLTYSMAAALLLILVWAYLRKHF